MIRNGWYFILLASALTLAACEKGSTEDEQAGGGETTAGETTAGETTAEIVEVAIDGSELDPPVQIEQIPPGAWICEMGTVHYASQQEGDGVCPICGMHLRQIPIGDARVPR